MGANSPSKRSHKMKGDQGLNLTPFIDMITCLMFFLMMFAGIIPVVIIDAPLPKIASTAAEQQKAKDDQKKLDITVFIEPTQLRLKSAVAAEKTFAKDDKGKFPFKDLHVALAELKTKDAKWTEMTIIPQDDSVYDDIVGVMDAGRDLQKGDAGYAETPPDAAGGEVAQFNRLFPDVSLG